MRIVINSYSARIGGGQTYLINLLRHLPNDISIKIDIFAPRLLELPDDPRINRVHTVWPTTNPLMRSVWERFILPFFLLRKKADILFCPGGLVNTYPLHRCRTVTMFRNMAPFDDVFRARLPLGLQKLRVSILKRVMLTSMKNADLTIFISDYARSVIENLTNVKHAVTIPHGIADEFRTQNISLPRPNLSFKGEYIVYVSRFDIYKHHMEVVRAYMLLPEDFKQRYKLLLVGETDMPEGLRVRDFIAENDLNDLVLMEGAIKHTELPAVYKNASLIVFASSCENCPNILLESMASGRPVLSSSVMPMPEFGREAVQYFDPRDPDDIAASIMQTLRDTSLGEELGARAAARSMDFSWSETAELTWAAITSIEKRRQ